MQERLQLLKDLQALDQDRQVLIEKRQKFLEEQDVLQGELDRIQTMVDSLTVEMAGLEEQRKELVEARTIEEGNITRSEERLPQIKTQKEYVAVLKEVDTAKKLVKELNEQIQQKDQELAALGADKEEKNTELSGLDDAAEEKRNAIGTEMAELDSQLDGMSGEREQLLERLPVRLRKRYQLLLERRNGLAVVEAKGGACLGCHMHLPPQQFNSLYVAKEVQSCPHCNRLLYIEDPS